MTLCGEGSSASSTHEELWRAEKPFLRVRELKRPEGSGMLISDPLGEGSNASSTNKESDLSQSSGERRTHSSEMRGNSDAPKGAACS